MAQEFYPGTDVPTYLLLDEPTAIRGLLHVLAGLDTRLSNLQELDLDEIRDLVTKARAEILDAGQRDDSTRVLMIEADRAIREHAAMSALCFGVLVALESSLSFIRKAWSGDDFPLAGDVTLDGAVRIYERANEQFARLPDIQRDDQPIRFVTAVGNTRGQMQANLAHADEGQALLDLGDASLVWVSQADLWRRAAASTLRSATAPDVPASPAQNLPTDAEQLLRFAEKIAAMSPETLARLLDATAPQPPHTTEEEPS